MSVPGTIAQFGDTPRMRDQLGLGPLATMSVLPWASASDSTTQSLNASDYTPQQVTFNTSEGSSDSLFASNSFIAKPAGVYYLSFSVIINLAAAANKNFHIWLRKNGVDIPRTDTHIVVANSNDDRATTVTFILSLALGDVITIWCSGDSTSLNLNASGALGGAKGYPASPSIIATFNFISP